jgi:hypothetical protein
MNVAEDAPADFLTRLEAALALRGSWLESARIPTLKEMLGTYRSLFESMAGTLIKKAMLREDPYTSDVRTSEITTPPDSALSDSGDDAEVSRRIFAYRRQLNFLVDGLKYNLAAMDIPALKGVIALLSYLDWDSFGEGSHSPTTRAFARLVTHVLVSKDGLSSRVLHDSHAQIVKLARDIRDRVSELEAWHRESWKAELRARVLARVSSQPPRTGEERTAKTLAIRKAFEQIIPEGTWYPPLVQEILAEDQPPGSAQRLEKLITSLAIPPQVPTTAEDASNRKVALVNAIRSLCAVSGEIRYCQGVLEENEHAIESRQLSFVQKVKRWFQKTMGRLDDRFYDIEHESKKETIDFLKFVAEMKELIGVLAEIPQAGSAAAARIEAMDEEQLCDMLDWQVRQIRQLHKRMEGLNELFQVKAAHDRKAVSTPRSIKLALLGIENLVVRADEVRRGSIARLERVRPVAATGSQGGPGGQGGAGSQGGPD